MQPLMTFLASGTARRLIVFVVGAAVVALNKKLGLNLDATEVVGLVTMTLGYVTQSAVKEASDNHAEAKVLVAKVENAPAPSTTIVAVPAPVQS